ncbi:MAG: hypothetical protein V1746_01350 [bacterium]
MKIFNHQTTKKYLKKTFSTSKKTISEKQQTSGGWLPTASFRRKNVGKTIDGMRQRRLHNSCWLVFVTALASVPVFFPAQARSQISDGRTGLALEEGPSNESAAPQPPASSSSSTAESSAQQEEIIFTLPESVPPPIPVPAPVASGTDREPRLVPPTPMPLVVANPSTPAIDSSFPPPPLAAAPLPLASAELRGSLPPDFSRAPMPPPSSSALNASSSSNDSSLSSSSSSLSVKSDVSSASVLVLPETATPTGDFGLMNVMSVGDFIVDERQLLNNTQVVNAEFLDAPITEVLRGLAEAADINYVLPEIETDKISINLRMPAFKALELIASQSGLEIIKEKDLWFIRKVDSEKLEAVLYKLHNIHLGRSGGGGASGGKDSNNRTFGMASDSNLGGGNSTSSSSNSNGNGDNNSSSETRTEDNNANFNTDFAGKISQDLDPFQSGSSVLDTIRELLNLPRSNRERKLLQEGATVGNQGENDSAAFVTYNADANSIYVIATEYQHQWVGKYIEAVDKASSNIAIDAMFVESTLNPTQALGVDWKKVAGGYTFRAGGGKSGQISFGDLDDPRLPTGVILNSDGLEATVRAWVEESKSRIARYPRVVCSNNQLVRIQTTENIPTLSNVNTTTLGTTAANTSTNVSGTTDNTQTDFTASTQQIGTIIYLVPQQINETDVSLKVGIEISSAVPKESVTGGETSTGRIATFSTVYESVIKVPSGKTLAIGGLEKIAEDSAIHRVPWLSEIPLFGFLFKDESKNFDHTSITLLLTPTILTDTGAKALQPSEFRDSRDERVMDDTEGVEAHAMEAQKNYRSK